MEHLERAESFMVQLLDARRGIDFDSDDGPEGDAKRLQELIGLSKSVVYHLNDFLRAHGESV